jgi:hypothetical protein
MRGPSNKKATVLSATVADVDYTTKLELGDSHRRTPRRFKAPAGLNVEHSEADHHFAPRSDRNLPSEGGV